MPCLVRMEDLVHVTAGHRLPRRGERVPDRRDEPQRDRGSDQDRKRERGGSRGLRGTRRSRTRRGRSGAAEATKRASTASFAGSAHAPNDALLEDAQELALRARKRGRRCGRGRGCRGPAPSRRPGLAATAPVKAPRSWPNSSLSKRSSERARRSMRTKGSAARGERRAAGGRGGPCRCRSRRGGGPWRGSRGSARGGRDRRPGRGGAWRRASRRSASPGYFVKACVSSGASPQRRSSP